MNKTIFILLATVTVAFAVEVTDPVCLENAADNLCQKFFPKSIKYCKQVNKFDFDVKTKKISFRGKFNSKSFKFGKLLS